MFTSTWFKAEGSKIKTEFPIRQVYAWILDKDNNVVIVSKDGEKWQLPGGKPGGDESLEDVAVREVYEETGLDISDKRADVKVFGYYEVQEANDTSGEVIDKFAQVRASLRLEYDPKLLQPKEPASHEAVKHAVAVPFAELPKYIPWIVEKREYLYIKSLVD